MIAETELRTNFRLYELLFLFNVFSNPARLFHRSLYAVLPFARLPQNSLVDVEVECSREMCILSTRRVESRYHITVRRGMFFLVLEATELVRARLSLLTNSGEVRVGPERTEDQLCEAVKHDVTRYLRTGRWGQRMAVLRDLLARRLRDYKAPVKNWKPTSMLLRPMVHFIVAHEVAHVEAGHCDHDWQEGDPARLVAELEADSIATEYWIKAINAEIYRSTQGRQFTLARLTESVVCNISLISVTILFGMLELLDDAAVRMGKAMTGNHPPAAHRYVQFRKRCFELGVNKDYFQHGSQVERIHKNFARLATTISWADTAGTQGTPHTKT